MPGGVDEPPDLRSLVFLSDKIKVSQSSHSILLHNYALFDSNILNRPVMFEYYWLQSIFHPEYI